MSDRDFDPCPVQPIVYGPGSVPQSRERILFEKVTELAFSQHETCRVTRERDALKNALGQIAGGAIPEPESFARDVLGRLERGELRKAAG
jgi:hypothetical protein